MMLVLESSLSYMGEVLHRIEEARDSLVCHENCKIFSVSPLSSKNATSESYLKKLEEFRKTTIGKAKVCLILFPSQSIDLLIRYRIKRKNSIRLLNVTVQ